MSAWLNNRNDLDTDTSQSPVFKAMMARASKAQRPEPQGQAPAQAQTKPQAEKKQVRFEMGSPKPYTPTQSSPKGDPAWAPQIDMASYAPMVLSAVILGATYFMSGSGSGGMARPAPVNIPGLGTF